MSSIKEELKEVIENVMLPETQNYLEELDTACDNNMLTEDEIEAKRDMEAFVEELTTILEAIQTNKISDEDAKMIYKKISQMLEEHDALDEEDNSKE